MALSTQQQMLVEQRVNNDGKSMLVAYLLLIFLGGLGVHRFYLGRSGSGAIMLVMCILGWLTLVIYVGMFLLIAVAIWAIVDLFLIPGIVESERTKLRARVSQELEVMSGPVA